jgi:hypothetical protein
LSLTMPSAHTGNSDKPGRALNTDKLVQLLQQIPAMSCCICLGKGMEQWIRRSIESGWSLCLF